MKKKNLKKSGSKKEVSKDVSFFGKVKSNLYKFWNYFWNGDSLDSYIVFLVLMFVFVKFVFFPSLGFLLKTDFPVVAIVSGSMEHKIVNHIVCDKNVVDIERMRLDLDEWYSFCGEYYENNYNMSLSDFESFVYNSGLDIGDVMVLYGRDSKDIAVGDVLVFKPQDKMENGESRFFTQFGPVIHRVVEKYEVNGTIYFDTKGDHNAVSQSGFEIGIPQEDVIGVAVFRVPYIGYVKILASNFVGMIVGVFR